MHNVTVVMFNLFMDGVVKEMEGKIGNVGEGMRIDLYIYMPGLCPP